MTVPYHNKALPKGAVLREWRLEEVLGVGGFGIVYRGRGVYFNELVAIKEYFPGAISDRLDDTTVAPTDSDSEELYTFGLSKFVEEAKVLWNLSKPERHPNIVSVRSLFEIHGTAYMVMDFEEGVSLSRMLKDGKRFDEASLLGIVRPIALGLDRAHRGGVLHRDIKPANILVDENGRPVLIDFGSARFDSGQATSTKVTFYTPPYAALEQYVKAYPQGPWTDIYALGVTLYECVAGKKPPEVLERLHGESDEPLSAREWPGFSPAFVRAVDAAMAIKPADRPQSIAQWLRMFDAAPEDGADEATRIARFDEAPTIIARMEAAAPAKPPPPTAASEPVDAAAEAPVDQLKVRPKVLMGAGAVAAVIALSGFVYAALRPETIPDLPKQLIAAASPAAPAQANDAGTALEALIADVRAVGRPTRELSVLTAGKATLEKQTGEEAARTGRALAAGEVAALAREAEGLMRDLRGNPAWTGAYVQGRSAAASVRKAKSELDSTVAKVRAAEDTAAAVAAAREALAASGRFTKAYAGGKDTFVAAQRQSFSEIDASTRQSAARIVTAGSGSKPWVLASKAQKDRYRQAQANAAVAQARLAELDQLSAAAAGSTDLRSLNAAYARVAAIGRELAALTPASEAVTPPSKS